MTENWNDRFSDIRIAPNSEGGQSVWWKTDGMKVYAETWLAGDNYADAPPADAVKLGSDPRVFFPGDTVPAGVAVREENHVLPAKDVDWIFRAGGPYVEIISREDWKTIVDRARAAREDRE